MKLIIVSLSVMLAAVSDPSASVMAIRPSMKTNFEGRGSAVLKTTFRSVVIPSASVRVDMAGSAVGCKEAGYPMDADKGGSNDTIVLAPIPDRGRVSVEEAIWCRRSVRRFTNDAPGLGDVSRLLWAAQGITDEDNLFRSAPSAGATFPLEVYLITPEYRVHYVPSMHHLIVSEWGDLREALAEAALGQGCVSGAPLVFVFAADASRTTGHYRERGELYVHIEVGCASENLMLQAAALGLGSVAVGAFEEDEVSKVLDLPDDWAPYLIVPVGYPVE